MKKQVSHSWPKRFICLAVVGALTAGLLCFSAFAKNTFIITDGESVTAHTTYASDPDQILEEAGITLGEDDRYTSKYEDGLNRIDVRRLQQITVIYHGKTIEASSYGESVADLLSRLQLALTEQDRLSVDSNAQTSDGLRIEVVQVRKETKTCEHDIPFDTVTYENSELVGDQTQTLCKGENGRVRFEVEITYENGKEVDRQILQKTVLKSMVSQVIVRSPQRSTRVQEGDNGEHRSFMETIDPDPPAREVKQETRTSESVSEASVSSAQTQSVSSSTASSESTQSTRKAEPEKTSASSGSGNTITTASGEVLTYSRVLTCSGTGYSCEGYTGYTYTGTVARVGAVAVDPSVIPLGSRLYVESNDGYCIYGVCTAEDIGGAVKGNSIDLYFNTIAECYDFGRRSCTVYILD